MSNLEIIEVVGVIVFFFVSLFIYSRYVKRQNEKFTKLIPPVGERYKVVKQEYQGKQYYVLCGVNIYTKIREIHTYYINHYDDEGDAIRGAKILNDKNIEEHKYKEIKKCFENNL